MLKLFSFVLLRIYILSIPASTRAKQIALATPPAPRMQAGLPLTSKPASFNERANPNKSVLAPLKPPSTLINVLTAPTASAIGSISTKCSITFSLCGTVTFIPCIPRAYAPFTASPKSSFSTQNVV